MTTKMEIQRIVRENGLRKVFWLTGGESSLDHQADERREEEAGQFEFSVTFFCHPEGQFLICRRTGRALRLVALPLTSSAKNTTLICQLTESGTQYGKLASSTLASCSAFLRNIVILNINSWWRCMIPKERKKNPKHLILWPHTAIYNSYLSKLSFGTMYV